MADKLTEPAASALPAQCGSVYAPRCIRHAATLRFHGGCAATVTDGELRDIVRDTALVAVRALASLLLAERAQLAAVREAARAWREEHPGETPCGLGYGRVTGPVVAAALATLEPTP